MYLWVGPVMGIGDGDVGAPSSFGGTGETGAIDGDLRRGREGGGASRGGRERVSRGGSG